MKTLPDELHSPSCLPPPPISTYVRLGSQLSLQSRKIDSVLADGNCFFRALSKEVLGSQRHHYELRQVVAKFILQNPKNFTNEKGVVQTCNKEMQNLSVEDYCKRMSSLNNWATDLEILAMATALQIDIYTFIKDTTSSHEYNWQKFTPIPLHKVSNPHFGLLRAGKEKPEAYHVELLNIGSVHYDRIACQDLDPPQLKMTITDCVHLK